VAELLREDVGGVGCTVDDDEGATGTDEFRGIPTKGVEIDSFAASDFDDDHVVVHFGIHFRECS
jgi:hypothetical protein